VGKKILIVYATAGIGHKKAALAVKAALDEVAPSGYEVTVIDALDYTNGFFKWTYLKAYLTMVNKMPTIWGLMYYLTDNKCVDVVVSVLRRINNHLNSGPFRRYLIENRPDVIISTHFFASEVVSDMKKSGTIASKLITVVTDYRLHSWWVADPTDVYVVGGDGAREDLSGWNVEPSRIMVLGIPVEPVFSRPSGRSAALAKASLKDGLFTVLTIGGGFGIGPIEKIVRITDSMPVTAQIIAICGHNDSLVKRMEEMKSSLKDPLTVLGFVDNVYEYMEVSDVLISKSGGITSTESMAKGLPMIVISPIIGQETRNSDFLTSQGAAIRIDSIDGLKAVLEDLASHPERLKAMRDAIARISKPRACYDVAKLALEL